MPHSFPLYQKVFRYSILAFLLLLHIVFLAEPITLATADLGRHLKNGELLFSGDSSVLRANFYSSTYPEHPFFNHHWASGIVFRAVEIAAGFSGISLLFLFISALTFFFFFHAAWRGSTFEIAALSAIPLLPLLAVRTEIRPEAFSYLFIGIFFWVLWNFLHGRISTRWIFLLPLAEMIWVNLHIYFIFGPALIGFFLLESFWRLKTKIDTDKGKIKKIALAFVLASLATLFNPFLLKGALYPLSIFNNYGYRLFENQSIAFLQKIVSYPPILYFEIALGISGLAVIAGIALRFRGKEKEVPIAAILFALGTAALAWTAVRNFTLFGYAALPGTALSAAPLYRKQIKQSQFFPFILLCVFLLMGIVIINPAYWNAKKTRGIGLRENSLKSIEFFKTEHLKGPIFNNYDIGGFLIYGLYPREKVFVDNRPEAYPASFFQDVYIPMQENDAVWHEKEKEYGFNAIFFYRNDLTPWAQKFLMTRAHDPEWAPVFVDDDSIIFLRRNGPNDGAIKKRELPQSVFSEN